MRIRRSGPTILFIALRSLADISRPHAQCIILTLIASAAAQKPEGYIWVDNLPDHRDTISHQPDHRDRQSDGYNFTSCNLMEAFLAPGTISTGSIATTPQATIVARCSFNEAKIKSNPLTSPGGALRDLTSLTRLTRSALPAPLTPWQNEGLPGLSNPGEIVQWTLWPALIIFLYTPAIFLAYTSLPLTLHSGKDVHFSAAPSAFHS